VVDASDLQAMQPVNAAYTQKNPKANSRETRIWMQPLENTIMSLRKAVEKG